MLNASKRGTQMAMKRQQVSEVNKWRRLKCTQLLSAKSKRDESL